MSVADLLRANDVRFRERAELLTGDDWSKPSLCQGWSNHDVLAHLVLGYRDGPVPLAREMVRSAGSFDRANAELARTLARSCAPSELLDEFTGLIDRPRGLGRIFPRGLLLGDHVTHELDILFALGLQPAIAAEAVSAVLQTQVRVPNPFVPAYRNSRGLRLRASDIDWRYGERGPLVQGCATHLLSVLGSRPKMLDALDGDGVAVLRSRLSRPTRTAG